MALPYWGLQKGKDNPHFVFEMHVSSGYPTAMSKHVWDLRERPGMEIQTWESSVAFRAVKLVKSPSKNVWMLTACAVTIRLLFASF